MVLGKRFASLRVKATLRVSYSMVVSAVNGLGHGVRRMELGGGGCANCYNDAV